jgi:protein-S-isoprenylcysteine O-methyltransferase Ste14
MFNTDVLIYVAHTALWTSFGITRWLTRAAPDLPKEQVPSATGVQQEQTARFSRTVLVIHMLAFGAMYYGIGTTVFTNQVPTWFAGQRLVGAAVIAIAAALMCWAVASFQSWRFRAKLDAGHQLTTDGPFGLMRHPIYMGMNLLALGTAIWIPSTPVWIGFVLMAIGGDIRARSEEVLLTRAFGPAYTDYCSHTRRFVPGLY